MISKALLIPVLAAMMAIAIFGAAEASIAFVGAGVLADAGSPVSAVTISLPSGVQPGDLLLAQVAIWDGTGSNIPTLPTGWTTLRHDNATNGNKITSWLFYKVAGSNEPGSYKWTISAQYAAGVMGAWRGASATPIDQSSGAAKVGASPLSLAAPSLTPSGSGELQVYFYGAQASSAPAIAQAAALNQRINDSSSREGFSLASGDLAAPAAGMPSPTYAATATLQHDAPAMTAQAVLLFPASQSGSPTTTPTASATATPTTIVTPAATATVAASATIVTTATVAATPVAGSIIFVAAGPLSDSSAPVTSVNIPLPAGVQSGDTLIAQIAIWDPSASNVPTPPAGWVSIRHDAIGNANKITSWVYYKTAGANEPGSYSWTIGAQYAAGVMGAWRNAAFAPIDNSSGQARSGNSPLSDAAPSLTPANNNELQVYFYGAQSGTGPALNLAGALTQRFNTISAKEGFSLAFGELAAPSAGTPSSTYTATAIQSGGAPAMTAQAILLIPASQSASPTPTATLTATPVGAQTPTVTATAPVSTATATPVDVLTYHNDNARTGQNLFEQILTLANVNSSTFGKLFEVHVDAKVDAQPLIKTQLNIPGKGMHDVLYVVTENDSVYAFDANDGSMLWPSLISLLGSGETASDTRGCSQVTPKIGITSTPVIVPSLGPHGTIFVVAMSKDSSGNYFQRIHALDLTTGAEQFGGPLAVVASYPGGGAGSKNGQVPFVPSQYKERAGLLWLNGTLYTSWASHCDIQSYTGWLMAYALNNQNNLAQTSVLNVTPNGSGGAIWQSGGGLAADAGNIYFLDANGTFDTTLVSGFPNNSDFGNAFIKLSTSGGLAINDYFNMSNTVSESGGDVDLGSGGAMVLPDMTDVNGKTRHLAVGAGKDSNIYLVDRDSMGKFSPADNSAIYQEVAGALPGGEWAVPAFFNNTVYYGSVNSPLRAFGFSLARITTNPTSVSTESFGYPGTSPSVSANGSTNGIVWAIEAAGTGVLHAYDAGNLGHELYNSNQASNGRDSFTDNKFVTPTIANGKVYVGTPNSVAVFGLL